jgi:hypothetical protein
MRQTRYPLPPIIRLPPPENNPPQHGSRRRMIQSRVMARASGVSFSMAMYVYNPAGEPVGFVFETSIYDLDGTPLGRIVGRRVHHFDGTYAGEWFKDMVVRHPEARPRLLPPAPVPARRPPAEVSYRLRAVVNYGFADAFPQLCEGARETFLHQAAE